MTDAPNRKNERLTPLEEQQLLDHARSGDPDALATLLQSYQKRMYAVCYRMLGNENDARDLTQDSLVRVIEGLDSYDGRSRLSTWVIRVTMNCCLSHLRRERLRRHASLDRPIASHQAGETVSTPRGHAIESEREPPPTRRIQGNEKTAVLLEALDSLDPTMKAVLVLRDLQELEYQQIAEVIEVPIGTVKSRLFRAREALRQAIEARESQH